MAALPDWALEKAACRGLDPRTLYEWAWNDKTGRPAPGLAKALSICETCSVSTTCLVSGMDEPYGVWGGAVPPERGQVRGIKNAMDADPIEILYALGRTKMRINRDGSVEVTESDFDDTPPEHRAEQVTMAKEADEAARRAWAEAAATYGSYLDVPAEVRDQIGEDHRRATVARAEVSKAHKAKADAAERAAEKARLATARCDRGHALAGYMPGSGKPVLTAGGLCRKCQAGSPADRGPKIAAPPRGKGKPPAKPRARA